ncbi:TetR/AcrR family transcriptional regulator [Actinokineospora sp. NBRC 105648]|uniref:TetR/AcrR family transcriptional regulator n=1 Tax=Actinokineospora sp. NBRC 105648 TaxID=3032206 RepID=UPI0024A00342|nr:TetR/AcrR family transcriptional regulator [Actinokineospora sp. NBRC 105648]GLZ40513.1 hypothetical protein Acsp05_41370 [Actinokineospora sp. NBRC 105648]
MARADSVRNRRNILDSTRELLAANGEQVGMDEIAAHAGVAVGTLYRHFPTKTDLIDAAMAELTSSLVELVAVAADRVEAGADPVEAMTGLLRTFVGLAAQDRAVKAAAEGLASDSLRELEERGWGQLQRIVDVAHAQGALHADITTADLALLVATAPTEAVPVESRERWIALAMRSVTA